MRINFIFLFFFFIKICNNCLVNEIIEGYCVERAELEEKIIFCKNYLPDNICVPYTSVNKIFYFFLKGSLA